ncbi:hypothetical protein GQ43DRAFT_470078 [Delitschia confertaspora ATCC 74209]|uniref:Uncharacterized protein n=1 Tax=Delitschia confertaspora ATCC 74209 TaxID=1513339 RepID=A0A9P4JQH8_9PLEO|nr:hypothetical protein GQ43DRAFT_470078 [Delitschia confertaspora ATCC 74209]
MVYNVCNIIQLCWILLSSLSFGRAQRHSFPLAIGGISFDQGFRNGGFDQGNPFGNPKHNPSIQSPGSPESDSVENSREQASNSKTGLDPQLLQNTAMDLQSATMPIIPSLPSAPLPAAHAPAAASAAAAGSLETNTPTSLPSPSPSLPIIPIPPPTRLGAEDGRVGTPSLTKSITFAPAQPPLSQPLSFAEPSSDFAGSALGNVGNTAFFHTPTTIAFGAPTPSLLNSDVPFFTTTNPISAPAPTTTFLPLQTPNFLPAQTPSESQTQATPLPIQTSLSGDPSPPHIAPERTFFTSKDAYAIGIAFGVLVLALIAVIIFSLYRHKRKINQQRKEHLGDAGSHKGSLSCIGSALSGFGSGCAGVIGAVVQRVGKLFRELGKVVKGRRGRRERDMEDGGDFEIQSAEKVSIIRGASRMSISAPPAVSRSTSTRTVASGGESYGKEAYGEEHNFKKDSGGGVRRMEVWRSERQGNIGGEEAYGKGISVLRPLTSHPPDRMVGVDGVDGRELRGGRWPLGDEFV